MNNIYIDNDSNTIYKDELEKFIKDCEKYTEEKIEYLLKEGFV